MIVKYRQQYQEMADLIGAQDYEAALRNMVGAGLSAREISEKFEIPYHSIIRQLRRLGLVTAAALTKGTPERMAHARKSRWSSKL